MNQPKKICQNCRFWTRHANDSLELSRFGTCVYPVFTPSNSPDDDEKYFGASLVYYTLGTGDTYLKWGENFGCNNFMPIKDVVLKNKDILSIKPLLEKLRACLNDKTN